MDSKNLPHYLQGLNYTDCVLYRGGQDLRRRKSWCLQYDTKQHLMVRLLFCRFGVCGVSRFTQHYNPIYGPNHHHHHHIVLAARISLTLSRHSSLSFIALGRSSGQQPVSSHSCWMYVRAGRPAFARPCVGIHKSTSLSSRQWSHRYCYMDALHGR